MTIVLSQLLQGAAGFLLLWFLFRQTLVAKQPKAASYDVLARRDRRYAVRTPPHFNWLSGLLYSTFCFLGLPLLIWRYGWCRALGLALAPLALAIATPHFIDISPFFVLLLDRSFIGLYVASSDSKYCERTLLKRGWRHIGAYESESGRHAIRESRLSQP